MKNHAQLGTVSSAMIFLLLFLLLLLFFGEEVYCFVFKKPFDISIMRTTTTIKQLKSEMMKKSPLISSYVCVYTYICMHARWKKELLSWAACECVIILIQYISSCPFIVISSASLSRNFFLSFSLSLSRDNNSYVASTTHTYVYKVIF